ADRMGGCGSVTFEQARPIVEARLYAYAALRQEYPDLPLVWQQMSQLGTSIQDSDRTSVQERWVVRHASEIRDAVVIEKVLRALPEEERRLTEMRYFEFARWDYICRKLSVSRATAYRIRDRALMSFALAWGLLSSYTTQGVEAV